MSWTEIGMVQQLTRIAVALERIADEGVVMLAYTKSVEPEMDAAITMEQQIENALAKRDAK